MSRLRNNGRIEEIMRWQFEVEEHVDESNAGRIVWTVDYEKNGLSRNSYFPPQDSRISAKINILADHPESIVTVFKEKEILNTATLTGRKEEYPLHVFAVSSSNKVRDVTPYADCFSTDSDVLRVAKDCRFVYVDGNETRGSENVTIIVRVGGHRSQVPLRVWVTEQRLDVELSDTKLSRINGWSVPSPTQRRRRSSELGLRSNHLHVSRGADDDDDEEGLEGNVKHDGTHSTKSCQLRMQQSTVEVYARFIIDSDSGRQYFRGIKVYLRITDLVRRQLRVADPAVASVKGNVIYGNLPGRTEVQVLSAAGHVVGERKIRVGRGRVNLSGISVRVVSGLSLQIAKHRYLPGAFTATAVLENKLVSRQQDALLDITLHYSDGSQMALAHVDSGEFDLKLQSLNTHVVQVPSYLQSPSQPSILAIGVGSGKLLKVVLRQPQGLCYYRRRPLAFAHVDIQVDFSKDVNVMGRVQSDAFFDNNRASDRWQDDDEAKKKNKDSGSKFDPSPADIDIHFLNKEDYFKNQHEKFPELSVGGQDPKVIPVEIAFDKMEAATSVGAKKKAARQEALEQAIDTGASAPRPFVIAMYVLLSLFFVATINCVLFTYRYYRRKRAPKDGSAAGQQGSVSNAKDWVWIGRATLERNNAQQTRGMHALMPEEDFNGNQMVTNASPPPPSNPPSAPPSNRNSTVSTYEGSECSIRITSNPLQDSSGDVGFTEAEWDYEKLGLTYDQLMDYFENLKESTA